MSKEIAQKIREELKSIGYTSRMVSVTCSSALYDTAINVHIKDFTTVKINKVNEISKKYDKVDYDERSGEILSGGNTYVFVDYDYSAVRSEVEKNLDVGRDIYNTVKSATEGVTLLDVGKYTVTYYPSDRTASILKRPEGYETMDCYCLDTLEQHHVSSDYTAAQLVVSFGMLLLNKDE